MPEEEDEIKVKVELSETTLRDLFAAFYMAGRVADSCWFGDKDAKEAYQTADAFLKARKEKTT